MKTKIYARKITPVIILLSLLGLTMAGCGSKESSEIVPLPIPEPIVVIEEPEPDLEEPGPEILAFSDENMLNGVPIIGVREVKDGLFQSYLTGAWKDEAVAKRRPMALVMPNNSAALPKYGISRADIIFEAPVEGRITRLVAFFEDYDDLSHLGPARSARDYFVYEAIGKRALFAHWGLAVPYSADLINGEKVDNISMTLSGIQRGADEAFRRIPRSGYSLEYTGYLDIEGYKKAIDRLGYSPDYPSDFVPQFIFAAEGTRVLYDDYPEATIIRPGGTSSNSGGYGNAKASFEYNEDENIYYRFQFNGRHIDEMNNEQLAVSNIVLQYAHGEVRDANDYLAFGVHGEGKAEVFTSGRVIPATWRRFGGDHTPAKFYDENDNEIIFNQGKTWICLIWNTYDEFVEYE
ncbi:MAG: DUF3048 domain-containing protein [Lachnospiraceae bacterium]|nr:DUF3048 domain-containing protein [Lachnospiraceae bacterium]